MNDEPHWVFNDGGRAAAGFHGLAGDCVVRAIAIAAERAYSDVYAELGAMGKAMGVAKPSPRLGVWPDVYRRWLCVEGWRWTPTMRVGQGTTVHLREDELPGGVLIAKCSRHIVAVIDGVVHDTHDCTRGGTRCVYGYWQPPMSRAGYDRRAAHRD